MGRKMKYESVTTFESKVNEYFDLCDKKNRPYTMSGLACHLDLDRKSLLNYSKNEKYFPTVKKAKQRIEAMLEEQLYRLGNNSGVIFNLKNNFGWIDKLENDENEEAVNNASEILVKIRKTIDDRYERN